MKGMIHFTVPLPSNDRRDTHTEGFMKYAAEIGPGAMIYIPNFLKIGSGNQKLIGGINKQSVQNAPVFLQ
jgi:hypothetical protein